MKPAHVALAIGISLIWGINFVAAKAAVGYFPTFFFLAVRVTIVAIVLSPFIRKPALPVLKLFKISIILTVFHFGFMFAALENGLDAAVAVVIDQLRVPFAVALGYFVFGENMGKKGMFGIAVAILGTFVIVGTPNVIDNYAAFWMLVGGSAAWAFYNMQVKNLEKLDVLPFIGWVSLLGAPQLFIISFILEGNQFPLLVAAPPVAIVSLLYVAVAATIIAHGCWYYLLKNYPINRVVPYTLLVPVFGMVAGAVLLDEIMTRQIIVGGILTILGVSIVVIRKPKSAIGGDAT
jgi:O-acetylserine/cysteine efflux transporter